ncbi:MAG TPA: hypothetical protein VGQ17_06895, partial [Gemmatimonadales bacterium]|nr:hypothetical protein [Gemmatimonadales bacterium]
MSESSVRAERDEPARAPRGPGPGTQARGDGANHLVNERSESARLAAALSNRYRIERELGQGG